MPDGHCGRDGAPAFAGSPACEATFVLVEMSWTVLGFLLEMHATFSPVLRFAEPLDVSMAFRRI